MVCSRPSIRGDRTAKGGGLSRPPYSFQHGGPCIVAGNAWCLAEDLAAAPDVPIIAVNGAAKHVKALALFSVHPQRFIEHGWLRSQQRLYGTDFTVHSANIEKHGPVPCVQYWWPDARGGGGSAWGARKVAWLMGFDPVILCGSPLDPGPYVGNHNLGGLMRDERTVQDLRDQIVADTAWHAGVISMSGWTREFFG